VAIGSPFVISDLFTVGIGFDLAGAYLLGRGLFTTPATILQRSTPRYDFHPGIAVGHAEDRVDAEAGISLLVLGFSIQVIAYALADLGATNRGSATAIVIAVGLAAATAGCASVVWLRLLRRRRLWRLLIEMSHYDKAFRRHELPSAHRLQDFGMALHLDALAAEVTPLGGAAAYARRVFGVRDVRASPDVELDAASLSKFDDASGA
jgi:hypothetical protein